MAESKCGLAPRDGASKEYQAGYWDALKTIAKGKVKDPEERLAYRSEKFLDGDAYSGGVAQALVDTGIASPLYTSGYNPGDDAYRCLMNGNKTVAKPKKEEKPAATVSEPKAEISEGKQCSKRYEPDPGMAQLYKLVETCTERVEDDFLTTTRTQTYQMTKLHDGQDILIGEDVKTYSRTINPPSKPNI